MASQTELEELVVRLTGEASGYLKMLTEAQEKTKKAAESVEKEASKIEKFKETMEGFQKTAVKLLSTVGIAASMEKAVEKFEKVELATKRMEAILEANGREVSKTTEEYKKFASEMAKVSNVSKGTISTMLEQAETMGLTGEKAKQAVRNAMSMAALKGSDDPTQYLRHMVLFARGKDARLAAMLGIGSEEEGDVGKRQEIQERLIKGMKLVEIEGQTSEARFARAKAAMGSFVTEVGEVGAKYVDMFASAIEKAATAFKSLPEGMRSTIVTAVLFVAAIEPASLALTFLQARFVAANAAFAKFAEWLIYQPYRLINMADAFNQMSAGAKAASLAVGGVMVAAAAALILTIVALRHESEKFNNEMKKSSELAEKLLSMQSKKDEAHLANVKNTDDLNERRRVGQPLLDEQEKRVHELEKALDRSKKDLEKADEETRGAGPFQKGGRFWGKEAVVGGIGPGAGAAADFQVFVNAVQERQKELDQAKEVQNQLKAAMEVDPKAIEDVGKMIEKYKEEAVTAGMTAAELELYNAQKKIGADNPMINALRENQQLAEQAKKTADATKSIQDYIEATQLKIETDGMSADELLIYKARLQNVDDKLLDQAKHLLDASKAQDQYNKFVEEGQRLTEEFLTPLQKFQDRTAMIFDQWEAGNISDETFTAAMQKATDDLDAATNAAEKAESAITSVNQAMSNSADAKSRLFNYQAELAGAQEATTNKFKGVDVVGASTRPVVNKLEDLRVLLARIAAREDTGGVDFGGADLGDGGGDEL